MTHLRTLSLLAFATFTLCAIGMAHAAQRADAVSPQDFVEQASAKGVAEIEVARLALEKAVTEEVKGFAQTMLEEHQQANQELAALASRKGLQVSDDAELINQAKALVLKLRSEESFDRAYINNQVQAHKQTIALFRQASESSDKDIAAFASETLPKLEHHLQMAEQINAQLPED